MKLPCRLQKYPNLSLLAWATFIRGLVEISYVKCGATIMVLVSSHRRSCIQLRLSLKWRFGEGLNRDAKECKG